MPIDTAKIWQLLKLLGVADEPKCRELAAQAAVEIGPEALSDTSQLATFLASKNLLTASQLSAIQNDNPGAIFVGGFTIVKDSAPSPFDGWKTATRQRSHYWIYETDLARLLNTTGSSTLPNLERLDLIEAIGCDELVPVESFTSAGKLVVAVPSLSGSLLKKALPRKPLSRQQSLNIFLPVFRAATVLHESNVAHGCIGIDKVWCKSETEFQLLIDPIYETFASPSSNIEQRHGGSILSSEIDAVSAPELTIAGQKATRETDVYALAVLLWRLAAGEMPFNDLPPDQRSSAHVSQTLDFSPFTKWPNHEVQALKRALAKNPSERYRSAMDFHAAFLNKVQSQPKPVSPPKLEPKPEPTPVAPQPTPQTLSQSNQPKSTKKIDASLLGNPSGTSKPTGTRRKRKRAKPKWVLPALMTAGLLAVIGLVAALTFLTQTDVPEGKTASTNPPSTNSSSATSPSATSPSTTDSLPSSNDYRVIADDGSTLWLPPHESDPIDISNLPAGAQAILTFSPEAISRLDSASAIFATLDANSQDFVETQQKLIGASISNVEKITIAMYPGIDGWPQTATRVDLKSTNSIANLQSAWNDADRQLTPSQSVLFVADEVAYFIPPDQLKNDSIQTFTFAQIDTAIELADSGEQEFELRRQLEELRESTSNDNAVTFLFAPSFLTADGRQLIEFYAPNFRDQLARLLDPTLPAGVLSFEDQPDCFVELRIQGNGQQNTAKLLAKLQDLFNNLADQTEQKLIDQPPPNFWRSVGIRLPGMLRTTAKYQRFGIEDGQAVTNLRLPPVAASNLVAGAWSMARQWADTTGSSTPTTAPQSLSIEDILSQTVTLSFGQQSLETTLQLLVEERNDLLPAGMQKLKFSIDGSAFESEGITRNKEIAPMDFRETPFRDTLTELAKRANSTVVEDPKSPDQKVVWRFIPDDPMTIELTTKKALKSIGVSPPDEFTP